MRKAPLDNDVVYAPLRHDDLPTHGCLVPEPEGRVGQAQAAFLSNCCLVFLNIGSQIWISLTIYENGFHYPYFPVPFCRFSAFIHFNTFRMPRGYLTIIVVNILL